MAVNINIPSEVTQTITDGVTTTAPSENAVFDALSLKANSADLADVATTGDYDDLINQPSIPSAQVNSDWNATSGVAEILNKPTIPSVTGFVPYTGATNDVNLGIHDLTATQGVFATSGNPDTLTVNHSSGSGKALTITKGGNGEGVYVNKTSGSGNAVTIIGDLEATNLKRTGGTSSQFLKANGSVDSTSYQPTLVSGTNIKTINGTSVLGAGDLVISGGGGITVGTTAVTSGTIGRVFFQATGDVVQQSANLFWDNTNGRLNLGAVASNTARLDIKAPGALSTDIAFRVRNSADSATILQVNGVGQVWANGKGFQTENTAFGQLSLNSCTTGNSNTAFGYNALAAVTTATTNTGFGVGTLQLTTGSGNTAVGYNSGRLITTGTYNTCIGYEAGSNGAPTSGVYIGYATGPTSTGQNVVAIGSSAAQGLTSGSGGVAIGNSARIGTTGAHNISLGQSAGLGLTTGSFNIHLGYRSAGSGVITGNYNTLIGGDSVIGDVSNNAVLADGAGNQAIRKDANHNVLLGREVALATTATNGFAYIPTCAGVPTGVPAASFTGKAPIVIDSTNNKMYIYTNAAWVALN